ncbi:hypothetical protein QTQ03_28045 [Micromonospora sp. WMMA1363]|uniref:hypothetical protein n=1 Tax=Micromonospora sp. WMMA1363 TaxID=3053985 RepID=UPI00259D1D92|nr:hypothetical protein [Micromonospora sp. WMMA1363]MDM4721173.1 hypothetical protein [Micromonospora sp. WMMA1363]MDM4722735.1 hypothetical protein [Micromonospora sp. WMMA1363]MDM4723261.1 hypothetical protein [Micromonospora sp. WMMA1363]
MAKHVNIRSIRQKGVKTLAWLSFGLAFVGGAFGAETFVGDGIEWVLEALPWAWLPVLLLIVAVVGTLIDSFVDGVPNWFAVGSALLAPSIATAVDGKFGDTISAWADGAQGWVNGLLTEWTGEQSAVGLTLACAVASLLMARRVIRKSSTAEA